MMNELSLVALTRSVPEHSLIAGDVGTIVHVYPQSEAYEVEFSTGQGKTIAVLTLRASDVRPIAAEILHTRSIAQRA